MQLPEGRYDIVLQTPNGDTLNRREIKIGHSEAERITLLAELITFKIGWESSGALPREHLSIKTIQR